MEECPANNNRPKKKKKSTQLNTTNFSVLTKKPLPNKSEKPSEEKPSKNTQIKEVIPINSKNCLMPIKLSPTLKKDNYMMSMESRVSRTVAHQEAQEDLEIFLVVSLAEDEDKPDQKKPSLSLLKSKSHLMTFIMAA